MTRVRPLQPSSPILHQLTCTFFFLLLIVFLSGCVSEKPEIGAEALAFRNDIRAKLDMYSAGLAPALGAGNRRKVRSLLRKFYAVSASTESERQFSLAVLDSHGVTIAALSGGEATGTQNYGNYQIVSRVLHKRRAEQSILYLQGGNELYIICSPLIQGERLVGALIIGLDSEHLKRSGVTEKEFMSLDFSPRTGVWP